MKFFCGMFRQSLGSQVKKTVTSDPTRFDTRKQKLSTSFEQKEQTMKILKKLGDQINQFSHNELYKRHILSLLNEAILKSRNSEVAERIHQILELILRLTNNLDTNESFLVSYSATLREYLTKFKTTNICVNYDLMIEFCCHQMVKIPTIANIRVKVCSSESLSLIVTKTDEKSKQLVTKRYDDIMQALIISISYWYDGFKEFGEDMNFIYDRSQQALLAMITANRNIHSKIIVDTITKGLIMKSLFVESVLKKILQSMDSKGRFELYKSFLHEAIEAVKGHNPNPLSCLEILRQSQNIMNEMSSTNKDEISLKTALIFTQLCYYSERIINSNISHSLIDCYTQLISEAHKIFRNFLVKGQIIGDEALRMLYDLLKDSKNIVGSKQKLMHILNLCKIVMDFVDLEKSSEFLDTSFFRVIEIIDQTQDYPSEIYSELLRFIVFIVDKQKIIEFNLESDFATLQIQQIKKLEFENLNTPKAFDHEYKFHQITWFFQRLILHDSNTKEQLELIYKILLSYVLFNYWEHASIKQFIYFLVNLQVQVHNESSTLDPDHTYFSIHVLLNVTLFCSSVLSNEDLSSYIKTMIVKNNQMYIEYQESDLLHTLCIMKIEETKLFLGDATVPAFNKTITDLGDTLSRRSSADGKNILPSINFISSHKMFPSVVPEENCTSTQNENIEAEEQSETEKEDEDVDFEEMKSQTVQTHGKNLTDIYAAKTVLNAKPDSNIDNLLDSLDDV